VVRDPPGHVGPVPLATWATASCCTNPATLVAPHR
jgi:hypothetical protein